MGEKDKEREGQRERGRERGTERKRKGNHLNFNQMVMMAFVTKECVGVLVDEERKNRFIHKNTVR